MKTRTAIAQLALVVAAIAPGTAAAADAPQTVQLGPIASPVTIAGGDSLVGRPIRPGTVLPAGMALVSRTLTLGAQDPRGVPLTTALSCPAGMVVAGMVALHPGDPSAAWSYSPDVRINRSTTAQITYSWERRLPVGATMTPGTVCATLRSQAVVIGPVRSPYVLAGGQSLIGRWIRVGTPLPRTIALVTRTVTLSRPATHEALRTAVLSCPDTTVPGEHFRVMELFDAGGRVDQVRESGFTSAELPRIFAGRARSAHVTYEVLAGAPAGASTRLGIVCKAMKG